MTTAPKSKITAWIFVADTFDFPFALASARRLVIRSSLYCLAA
jgi:hypothetical protein